LFRRVMELPDGTNGVLEVTVALPGARPTPMRR
jgi:hypothetical protein